MKLTLMFAASSMGLLALAAIPQRLAAQEDSHQRAIHTRHYLVTDLAF